MYLPTPTLIASLKRVKPTLASSVFFLAIALAQVACGEAKSGLETETTRSAGTDRLEDPPTETLSGVTGELQGRWRSVDDSLHTLTFEGNLMTMGYEGTPPEEPENFVVGPTCPDAPEAEPGDNSRYLSVPDARRCYYIIELTDNSLQLSYVGRGNTLRYTR